MFMLLFLVFASGVSFGQDPQKAKMTPFGRGFLEYLPSGYSTSTTKYPAIIFLHGSGERGTGSASDLSKVKRQGPPKHIAAGHKMGFTVNGKTEYFIVLSPQTNEWSWKYDVVPFVQWALQNYRIDPDRVYVTGLSMGGEGTWFSAGLDDNSPNLFAAIAVMAGRGSLALGTTVASRHLNVWAFHGDADTALGIGGGLLPITGMLNFGANPAPIWTVYPGVGHSGCWDRAYRTDHTYHNPNVYEWFLSKRKPGTSSPAPAPAPPVANAGADKIISLPSSSSDFTASATDSDGQISSYQWTKISGPSATLSNTSSKTLSVSNATTTGTYTFRVTVKDNANLQDTDDVVLTVSSSAGKPPVAYAGIDKSITLPSSSASFTASGTDSDGQVVSYTWTKISGPAATLLNATTRTVSIRNATTAGTYTFRVTVKDNNNLVDTDDVTLTVKSTTATPTNQPPIVDAGVKKYITLPSNTASFTATASDPDGSIVSYQWTKIGGGVITMSGTTTPTLYVKNALEGTYVFEVKVKDNKGATATAVVRLAVRAAVASLTPEATWEVISGEHTMIASLSQVTIPTLD
jgi:hypothetical protein